MFDSKSEVTNFATPLSPRCFIPTIHLCWGNLEALNL